MVNQNSEYYAFTVKDVRKDVTDYKPWFTEADKAGCKTLSKSEEYDRRGKLHYHGLMAIPKGLYRKSLMMYGIHYKLVKLRDIQGWLEYINKDQDIVQQIPRSEDIDPSTLKKLF